MMMSLTKSMLLFRIVIFQKNIIAQQNNNLRRLFPQGFRQKQNLYFRWAVYLGAVFSLVLFGVYGFNYDSSAGIPPKAHS